jgi:hypothetical protein
MDYTTSTALDKYQWDAIHYPNKEWFSWLEEEEEGEAINIGRNGILKELHNDIN